MDSLRKQRPKGMLRGRAALVGLVCAMVMLWPGQASAAPTWQPATDLSAPGQDAREPQLALDQSGNALAVWLRPNGSNTVVQSAWRPAGGSWGATQDVSAPGGHAFTPQVAFDGAGNALAVWTRSNGANEIAQAAWRTAGGIWQPAQDLSAAGQDASYPQVAVNGAGTAVVVWERWNGTERDRAGCRAPDDRPLGAGAGPVGGRRERRQRPGRDQRSR